MPRPGHRRRTGDDYDAWLFRRLFPEAPYGTDERLCVSARIAIPGATPFPFRKKWFDLQRYEFVDDPHTGDFRLQY